MVQKGDRGEEPPRHQLHIHKAPRWLGPNAFALPSGDIFFIDALCAWPNSPVWGDLRL